MGKCNVRWWYIPYNRKIAYVQKRVTEGVSAAPAYPNMRNSPKAKSKPFCHTRYIKLRCCPIVRQAHPSTLEVYYIIDTSTERKSMHETVPTFNAMLLHGGDLLQGKSERINHENELREVDCISFIEFNRNHK